MIRYTFRFDDGAEYHVEIDLERVYRPRPDGEDGLPPWTALGFHRCPNCPLPIDEHPRCPAAVDLHLVTQRFAGLRSCDLVDIRVETPERTILKRADVQTGLQALFGLLMATSGCPILRRLRPLAYQHLPFATLEETVWRVAAGYLLEQYFRRLAGRSADFELAGLRALYAQLEIVNAAFCDRIRAADERDANVNAVALMSFLSQAVSLDLDGLLAAIREHARPGGRTR